MPATTPGVADAALSFVVRARVGVGLAIARPPSCASAACTFDCASARCAASFRRVERREQLARAHARSAIDANALHEAGHPRVNRHRLRTASSSPGIDSVTSSGCSTTRTTSIVGGGPVGVRRLRRLAPLAAARPTSPSPERRRTDRQHRDPPVIVPLFAAVCALRIVGIERRRRDAARTAARARTPTAARAASRTSRPRARRSPRGRAARSRSAPSPSASAIGSMPAIIAALVIRTGRSRDRAAVDGRVERRCRRGARLLGEGHEQNRVRDRDADRHDRAHERLDVQRRAGHARASATTPASTAGTVET